MAILNKDRHIRYFLRCLRTFLPTPYTASDSNRALLAFFIVSGLDILGVLESTTTPDERQAYIEWIYNCQLPYGGGFRAFPGTDFGLNGRTPDNLVWDPANLPATFFFLVLLLVLGDDLSRVKRRECLQWLHAMQRSDGSFGEILGVAGAEGGRDLRFCCVAAGIRYILRGRDQRGCEDVEDINIHTMLTFIEACQTYDGGIGETPFCESHAGLAYTAIGALTFLRRTPNTLIDPTILAPGTLQFESLVGWLVSGQTSDLGEEDDEEEEENEEEEDDDDDDEDARGGRGNIFHTEKGMMTTLSLNQKLDALPPIQPQSHESIGCAGFSGRTNKTADTCYSFWIMATLAVRTPVPINLHLLPAKPQSEKDGG